MRTVAQIQQLFIDPVLATMTVKGTADQLALAEWLVPKLDVAASANPGSQDYPVARDSNDVVVVYGLAHADSPRTIQEIITNLRSVLDIQKIFQVSAPKVLAVRGSASQVQMAEWLISELDRQTAKGSENEARVPGGNDDVVHVFYLAHITSEEGLKSLLTAMHTTAHIMKAYVFSAPAALVVRGTADRIGMAGRMIELSDHPLP